MHWYVQDYDFGCLQVKCAVGPSGKPVPQGRADRCSSLLVFPLSQVLALHAPLVLAF